MNAWQSKEGSVEGTGTAKSTLSELDPQSFLSARSFDDWIVVNTSPGASSTTGLIPEQIWVPYSREGEKRFVMDIRALLAKRNSFTRLLFVNDGGGEYKQLQHAVGKLEGGAVFYLSGGQKALKEQLNLMEAMRNSGKKTTGTFTVAGAGGAIRKPCGSCP